MFRWDIYKNAQPRPRGLRHPLSVRADKRLVKQMRRWMHFDLAFKVEVEVDKLFKADFIKEVQYPTWLTNIVSGGKKEEKGTGKSRYV